MPAKLRSGRGAGFARPSRSCCPGGEAPLHQSCSSNPASISAAQARPKRLLRVPALGAQLERGCLGPAPSIISPMIEREETAWPSFTTSTAAPKRSDEGDELGGGAGVEAAAVADHEVADKCGNRRVDRLSPTRFSSAGGSLTSRDETTMRPVQHRMHRLQLELGQHRRLAPQAAAVGQDVRRRRRCTCGPPS